jgi:hypothetical protein
VYTGCVGSDDLAKQLSAANDKEGLKTVYQVLPEGQEPTGACAVIITGHNRCVRFHLCNEHRRWRPHRSLVTKLAAAEKFTAAHLDTPEVKKLIEEAEFFYVEGFFLTHGLEACLKLAKYAADNNKVSRLPRTPSVYEVGCAQKFALNLSAPFIPQFFTSQLDEVLPYVDVLFGNETEAEAYATAHGWEASRALLSEVMLMSGNCHRRPPPPSRCRARSLPRPSTTPLPASSSSPKALRPPSSRKVARRRRRPTRSSRWPTTRSSTRTVLAMRSLVHSWLPSSLGGRRSRPSRQVTSSAGSALAKVRGVLSRGFY